MSIWGVLVTAMLIHLIAPLIFSPITYFRSAMGEQEPHQLGFNAAALERAIEFAKTHETDFPRDFATQETIFGKKLGPLPPERGRTNGLVIRHGYIVASFGDTARINPTSSAAKSFLSSLLGVALRDRKIAGVKDRVASYVKDGGYDKPSQCRE